MKNFILYIILASIGILPFLNYSGQSGHNKNMPSETHRSLLMSLNSKLKPASAQAQIPVKSAEITSQNHTTNNAQNIQQVPPQPQPTVAQTTQQATPAREPCDYISDYDWDVKIMRAIAMAESGCIIQQGDNYLTYTINGRTYGYSVGVFQVRILPGREQCDTIDPAINVECAYKIYKSQGYNAWTKYNTGEYLKYY